MLVLKPAAGSGDEPLESLLGYNLRRLSVVTMADFAATLAPLGLTPVAASVLFTIGSKAGLTQSDLGRALGIMRANMTPLVAGLIKRGLLEREPLDGRSQALRLSIAGRAVHRQAWKAAKAHEDRLFGSLTRAARSRLTHQLRTIWRNTPTGGV